MGGQRHVLLRLIDFFGVGPKGASVLPVHEALLERGEQFAVGHRDGAGPERLEHGYFHAVLRDAHLEVMHVFGLLDGTLGVGHVAETGADERKALEAGLLFHVGHELLVLFGFHHFGDGVEIGEQERQRVEVDGWEKRAELVGRDDFEIKGAVLQLFGDVDVGPQLRCGVDVHGRPPVGMFFEALLKENSGLVVTGLGSREVVGQLERVGLGGFGGMRSETDQPEHGENTHKLVHVILRGDGVKGTPGGRRCLHEGLRQDEGQPGEQDDDQRGEEVGPDERQHGLGDFSEGDPRLLHRHEQRRAERRREEADFRVYHEHHAEMNGIDARRHDDRQIDGREDDHLRHGIHEAARKDQEGADDEEDAGGVRGNAEEVAAQHGGDLVHGHDFAEGNGHAPQDAELAGHFGGRVHGIAQLLPVHLPVDEHGDENPVEGRDDRAFRRGEDARVDAAEDNDRHHERELGPPELLHHEPPVEGFARPLDAVEAADDIGGEHEKETPRTGPAGARRGTVR